MTNRTRTQITIHTRQRIVVHSLPNSYRAWCERCFDVVVALTPESVETLFRLTSGALDGLFKSGDLHEVEEGAKSPLICGNSLSKNTTEDKILIEGVDQ
jgi:hypothetical protein